MLMGLRIYRVLTLDAGDLNMSCPNKINFNSDICNYISCDNNVGGTGFGGINVIGYNAVKIGTSAGNTGSLILNGQKVEVSRRFTYIKRYIL